MHIKAKRLEEAAKKAAAWLASQQTPAGNYIGSEPQSEDGTYPDTSIWGRYVTADGPDGEPFPMVDAADGALGGPHVLWVGDQAWLAFARQDGGTDMMIFDIPFVISYVSRFCQLEPGDLICTGSPGGSAIEFDPPRYLKPGDFLEVEIEGIGTLQNPVEAE